MLIGRKIGMTQVFQEDGKAVSVTVVKVDPCVVIQKKTAEKNGGVNAIQIASEPLKEKHASKPQLGHAKKAGLNSAYRFSFDMRVENLDDYKLTQELKIDLLEKGKFVDVTGTTKGKGFQGVIKRHGHHGGPAGHGSHFHRAPGSIGCSAYPARVIKGRPMPGQCGNKKITTQNVQIVEVYPEDNLVLLKGAVPGATQGSLLLKPAVKMRNKK